jgi:hypothetical protein
MPGQEAEAVDRIVAVFEDRGDALIRRVMVAIELVRFLVQPTQVRIRRGRVEIDDVAAVAVHESELVGMERPGVGR